MTVSPQNTLSYLGVQAKNPPNFVPFARDPNAGDYNFPIGTNALNTVSGAVFELTNIAGSVATWTQLGATAGTVATLTADVGVAAPLGGTIDVFGTAGQGLTTSAAGHAVTLTNSNWTTAQKGVGTLATNAEAIAGAVSTKAIVPSSLAAKLGTQTNHGVLVGAGSAAAITALAVGTNGQVLLGSAGANPVFATLTSTLATIAFTTGAGSLVLDAKNDALAVVNVVGSPHTLAAQTSHISDFGDNIVTFNLPALASVGQVFEVVGFGTDVMTAGTWVIQAGAGQNIYYETGPAAPTGQLLGQDIYSCAKLKCVTANTDFVVISFAGPIITN